MSYAAYLEWKTRPLTEAPELSVIIPAYNEEVRILPTIGAIAGHLCSIGRSWELIVADDGSRDRTVEVIEDLGLANVRVLRAERNGGKGSAVRRGVLAARGQYVLFADADNSTPIEEIDKLLTKLEVEGYDIAIGSRAIAGAEAVHRPLHRRLMSAGLRWIVRQMLRVGVRDTQCGFKLSTQPVARRLHAAQTLMGFAFDLEILFLAARLGYRIAEVPVKWVDAPGSKIDPARETRRFLRDLARIRVNSLRGVYGHL